MAEFGGLALVEQWCDESRPVWVGPGQVECYSLLLPRTGAMLLRLDGEERFVDPSVVNVEKRGQEIHVSHPRGPCAPATRIIVPDEVGERHAHAARDGAVPRTARLDLRHWALLAACRRGIDGFETADRIWTLLDELLSQPLAPQACPRNTRTERAHRRLAYDACELFNGGEFSLGLTEAAAQLGSSPSHLSRVFRRVTGRSVTAYRNQLRIQSVLRDLADGAPSLRTLASRYGFADQAHLTRVTRAHTGQLPSAIKRLLQPGAV
ncbi:MAG: helix-turn-helix domain-containing protein [Micromonosporaceae bacterium]